MKNARLLRICIAAARVASDLAAAATHTHDMVIELDSVTFQETQGPARVIHLLVTRLNGGKFFHLLFSMLYFGTCRFCIP